MAKNMKETNGVLPATKENRGNLTFLPLQHLAFSAPMLRASRLLNLSEGCPHYIGVRIMEIGNV